MSRTHGRRENWRVVITPNVLTWSTDPVAYNRRFETACDDIVAAVKRHVDDVEDVWVEADSGLICEHCGARWTEDGPDYNGCCEADERANPENEQVTSASPLHTIITMEKGL